MGRLTLGELKQKDVVNVRDGMCLGRPIDLTFCESDGRSSGIVTPGEGRMKAWIRGERCGVVIPWERICRIGEDVILVDADL